MGSAFRQFAYFVRHYPDSDAQETLVNLLRMRYVEPISFAAIAQGVPPGQLYALISVPPSSASGPIISF